MSFGQSTYSVNEEAGVAQIELVLSNPSSNDITVQVRDTKGTATGEWSSITKVNGCNNVTEGVDYDPGPYTVTFAAGETSVSFDVPINNDDIPESIEMFSLVINSSLPDRVTVGSPSQATVTLQDNDSEFLLY